MGKKGGKKKGGGGGDQPSQPTPSQKTEEKTTKQPKKSGEDRGKPDPGPSGKRSSHDASSSLPQNIPSEMESGQPGGRKQPAAGAGRGQPATGAGRGQPETGAGRVQPATGYGRGQPATGTGKRQPETSAGRGPPADQGKPQTAPVGGHQIRPQTAPSFPPLAQVAPSLPQPPRSAPPYSQPPPSAPSVQPTRPPQPQKQSTPQNISPSGSVTSGMKELSISTLPRRKEKGGGSYGRPIILEANYFSLSIKDPNMAIFHYDVDIKPDKPFRLYRKVVTQFGKRNCPNNHFAYDGKKNIITNIEMNASYTDSFTVIDEEKSPDHKGIDYTIVVSFANKFRLSKINEYMQQGSSMDPPQLMIMALDVALRNPAHQNPRFMSAGRSFFPPPSAKAFSLGGGLNLWRGFYQSVVIAWRPFLNVDVAHKGFPEQINCVQALQKFFDVDVQKPLTDRYAYENYSSYIKNLKVVYELPGNPNSRRTYKITGLAATPKDKTFVNDKDNNKTISVVEYFEKIKRYRLKYPHLPCLQAGPKTPTRDVCLPMELCTVMDMQVSNKKLDEKQTAAMVKAAARPTYERKENIMRSIGEVKINQDRCVQQFGLTVGREFEKINARIIPPPDIQYSKNVSKVTEGVWRAGTFLSPAKLDNWAIVNLDNRTYENALQDLYSQFISNGRQVGIQVERPEIINIKPDRNRDIKFPLQQAFTSFKEKNVQLVVVVIPTFGDSYGKVKQCAELNVGVLTQCLKSKTVGRLNPSTVTNILLKVNAKLNGFNHSIVVKESKYTFLNRPIIIMGADVTHPSPDQTEIPSVAAVTASYDKYAYKYNIRWQLQDPKLEIIQNMKDIVRSQLMQFYITHKIKPHRIVFYRDGVSEGQFKMVLQEEVRGIRNACTSLEADYKPSIVFIVVQKRHHTRFFPSDKDAVGKNQNVPPGTVVDTTITHPVEKDFFLNSHASIQGTSKPSKYHVLWDDQDLSMDELETMTYYLCHLFTRCTRAISYPAPTYYAHLAAFRIRAYCEGRNMTYRELTNEKLLSVQKELMDKHPMFFV